MYTTFLMSGHRLQQTEKAVGHWPDCTQISNIYILGTVPRAGDDVEIRTEAEAGVHQIACAVWGRMQLRRQPWLCPDTNGIGGKAVGRGRRPS